MYVFNKAWVYSSFVLIKKQQQQTQFSNYTLSDTVGLKSSRVSLYISTFSIL